MEGADPFQLLTCATRSTATSEKTCNEGNNVCYCSPLYKKNHGTGHEEKCLAVNALHEKLVVLHENVPNSLFRTAVGCFSAPGPSLTYLKVRSELIRVLMEISYEEHTAEAWNEILDHQLEMLRLDRYDFCGIRLSVVFTLLRVGRDDDCVSFMKYFLDETTSREHFDGLPDTESKPGDWIYHSNVRPHNRVDCRFEDIISDDVCFAFLVALLICKLRILAEHDARRAELSAFIQSTAFQKLRASDDIMLSMKHAIVGDRSAIDRVESQGLMCHRLMSGITKRNLEALINIEPLDHMQDFDRFVFEEGRRFFRVTPGAKERVQSFINDAAYDSE